MGKHLTEISSDALKEGYKNQFGFYPSWLGQAFGLSNQRTIYHVFDSLYSYIDDLFPDYFPLGDVQNVIMNAIKSAYQLIAYWGYADWAQQGDQIVKQFDSIVADFTVKLQNAVDRAQAQLDQLNSLTTQAKQILENHGIRIQELEKKLDLLNILDLKNINIMGLLP
jgi:hypothetical protein